MKSSETLTHSPGNWVKLGAETMVIGIDVGHPPAGCVEAAPSIAAVVATIDGKFAQWPARLRAQNAGKESKIACKEPVSSSKTKSQSKETQAIINVSIG